jgi:2-oxoglutarate/2-oxoacid ferredoxin oxidoreductase subunit alpha
MNITGGFINFGRMKEYLFSDDISIVLAGEAGQGIQAIELIITHALKKAGHYIFSTSEFMSRIRGGSNSTEIRVSSRPVAAAVDRIDILVALDKEVFAHLDKRISSNTAIIADRSTAGSDRDMIDIPFGALAAEAGGKIYTNTIAAGVLGALLGIDAAILQDRITSRFGSKDPAILQKNLLALQKGYESGSATKSRKTISVSFQRSPEASGKLFMSGVDAIGLGAIAGGCNFVCSYPMSPSTDLITFMARNSHEFGIIVEQVEDEVAALNMALGAWYTGARAMVTTSGGGFALMVEAVSLAGMIETPAVIHVGQRPGPATGLPTRTEQADLEMVLYAGHGEFPRAIVAPGTLADAFALTQKAFNLADKYQIPVFILTDEFFLDSSFMTDPFDVSSVRNERCIVQTDKSYQRYAVTANGVSPRGIPGNGDGLVRVDSDEHTEEGLITEDAGVRKAMVEKRLRKLEQVRAESLPPRFEGGQSLSTLVVCWGSTYSAVREALALIGRADIGLLHIVQPYPLHASVGVHLNRTANHIMVEGNATGQMARLIRLETGVDIEKKILKYDGAAFGVDWLVEELSKMI